MSFSWLLVAPMAFRTLEPDCARIFVSSRVLGTALLVCGMLLDNYIVYPDAWFETDEAPTPCVCYSNKPGKGGGWIVTSHALWHITALVRTIVSSVGYEYVILNSHKLND